MITPNAPMRRWLLQKNTINYIPISSRGDCKVFGMIANRDDNVGRLLALLKERKVERKTLVIFRNDNGCRAGGRYKTPECAV